MRLVGYLVGSLILAITGGGSHAREECPVEISYAYYEVDGETFADIKESIRSRGPVDERGKRRYARTDWKVDWRWERDDNGVIRPGSVKVLCKAVLTLPQLNSTTNLSPAEADRWRAYQQLLLRHELNHVRHVEAIATEIPRRIKQRQERYGKVSAKSAQRVAKSVLQDIRELDRSYDSYTVHGATEGI
jgi:predicted secreted Zn-dependent protease